MSDEQDELKLSLEPPKLFGRKKKPNAKAASSEAPAPAEEKPEADARQTDATDPETDDINPADAELTAVIEDIEAAEASPDPDETEADEPAVDEAEQTVVLDPVEDAEPGVDEVPDTATVGTPVGALSMEVEPEPVSQAELEDAEIAARVGDDAGRILTMYQAAAVTGLVVGAAMVVLTWLSLRGCEAVRGTASCGGGPGFLLLVATFAVSVLLGGALLKAFAIPDPGSSSFLAVGLLAVVALLFLIDFLDNWAMLIVIPVLGIAAFLASVWVTKTFVEPVDT